MLVSNGACDVCDRTARQITETNDFLGTISFHEPKFVCYPGRPRKRSIKRLLRRNSNLCPTVLGSPRVMNWRKKET